MTGRILIVDGLATNRLLIKGRLAPACYQVETAATLAEARARLHDFAPDLVIVGAHVPGHGCAEICAHIRAAAAPEGPAIIALCEAEGRLAAMRAGATVVLAPRADGLLLLARVRGLLRDSDYLTAGGFAESQAAFHPPAGAETGGLPRVTLIADNAVRALSWKHALVAHLPWRFAVRDAEQALSDAAGGVASDLYLIAADLAQPGEGLRLLSELRSRPASRDAAFVIASAPDRQEMAAIALDLGAGETLGLDLAAPEMIEASALALRTQIQRKR